MSVIDTSTPMTASQYSVQLIQNLKTLTVVATHTTRFRNKMLKYVQFPEGLKVMAHIRNGLALPFTAFEFIRTGDVLIFSSRLDEHLMQRLVF